ncbi:MAG: S8/S53 family peptidase [Betaproteobacteria bacterium]
MLKFDRARALTKGRAHISIVDTGYVDHPELQPGLDGNLRLHISQPLSEAPSPPPNYHATMVASVMAARGFDGKGISGGCPYCSLSLHNLVDSPAYFAPIRAGASVINFSVGYGGNATDEPLSCNVPGQVFGCDAMARAAEREIVMVAIAQNQANYGAAPTSNRVPFPANYPSVIAVGGLEPDGSFWTHGYELTGNAGSNWGPKIRLVAPAKDVLVAQKSNTYLYGITSLRCGDRVDSTLGEAVSLPAAYAGYGDCTGTSFSAPFVSALAGLIRSANPLLSAVEVREIMYQTATQPVLGPTGSGLVFYIPNAESAVQAALGGTATNRVTPMFTLYSTPSQEHLYTSSPQTALAAIAGEFKLQSQASAAVYQSFGNAIPDYALLTGKLCDTNGANCNQPVARSFFNVFTTENSPVGGTALAPLYRMSQVCLAGAAGCKTVRAFAYATDRTQVQALEAKGYVVDGVEGFVYSGSAAKPANSLSLCSAFDPARVDTILYASPTCTQSQLVNANGESTGGTYQSNTLIGYVPAAGAIASVNYTDLWFNAAESGWGIHITQHGQQLFGAWFTYDEQGNQLFLTISGCNIQAFDGTTCSGDLYRTTGPSYKAPQFDPAAVGVTKIGSATLTFTGQDTANFNYRIGNTNITKSIQRQPYGSTLRSAFPSDLSDHFFKSDAAGWGVAIAQHGTKLFAVIYHYDIDGKPMFITLPDSQAAGDVTSGKLYRTRSKGSNYLSIGWNTTDIEVTEVGSATIQPSQEKLNFNFTVDGYAQQRQLSRLPF